MPEEKQANLDEETQNEQLQEEKQEESSTSENTEEQNSDAKTEGDIDWKAKAIASQKEVQENLLPKLKELEDFKERFSQAINPQETPKPDTFSDEEKELGKKLVSDPTVSDAMYNAIKERMIKDQEQTIADKQDLENMLKKYDGSDGNPKFDSAKVDEYRKDKGISREDAYYLMHKNEILDNQVRQINTRRSHDTQFIGADRVPTTEKSMTDKKSFADKIKSML